MRSGNAESIEALADARRKGLASADDGWILSLYLDLATDETPSRGSAETRFRSLLQRARRLAEKQQEELGREEREALHALLHDLEARTPLDRAARRAVAFFGSTGDGRWQLASLPRQVEDDVYLGRTAALARLIAVEASEPDGIVVAVGRERGLVLRRRRGALEPIDDVPDEVRGRHDQGGWSQARYSRGIEEETNEHLRRVAAHTDHALARAPHLPLVVATREELRDRFVDLLAGGSRERIAGWVREQPHEPLPALDARVRTVLEAQRELVEAGLLGRFRAIAGRDGGTVSGWPAVLAAASDGRVSQLLYEPGAAADAWECPACARAAAEGGACPLDGSRLQPRPGAAADLAVAATLRFGGAAVPLLGEEPLGVGPVGAILRA